MLHFPRPVSGPVVTPASVTVQASALFQILDLAMRKKPDQDRVIGTLLGVRSVDGLEVEIRSAYTVAYGTIDGKLGVAMEYHRDMFKLYRSAHPQEVVVGWFSTFGELDASSGSIQDLYAQPSEGIFPYSPIHLAVDVTSSNDINVQAYVASSIGVPGKVNPDSYMFVPVKTDSKCTDAEASAMAVISGAKNNTDRSAPIVSDFETLRITTSELLDLLEKVSAFVETASKDESNAEVGKYLLRNLAVTPSLSAASLEQLFNNHLHDLIMVTYLANTVKTQLELSNRLTPLV